MMFHHLVAVLLKYLCFPLHSMPKSKEVLSTTSGSDSDSEVEKKVLLLELHAQFICLSGLARNVLIIAFYMVNAVYLKSAILVYFFWVI